MLQQLGELWNRFLGLSPIRQVLILAAPVVAIAIVVLGSLMIWTTVSRMVRPQPPAVVQATAQPTRPANELVAIEPHTPAAGTTVTATTAVPSPMAEATPRPVIVPGRDASPAPSPEIASVPTPSPTPQPPRSARVVNTEGQGANMRQSARVSAARVKVVPEGTIVELIGTEQRGDGYTWRNVRDADGAAGYVIADYLSPIEGVAGAAPVLPPPVIRVDEITSPAPRGGEATLKIITRPGVRCELRVLLYGPSNAPRDGLQPMTANDEGVCSWTWSVPQDTVPGTWRYQIVAGEGESRSVREVPIVIS